MKLKVSRRIFLVVLIFLSSNSFCQVRLPRLVSDGMILQRDTEARIWGWASVGESVSVVFNKKTYNTKTGSDGKWMVKLPKLKAGGPYTMDIHSNNHIIISNILVGDVWVCSGQSNMVLPMERVKERYPDEIAKSENQFIRHYIVPMVFDFNTPQDNVVGGKWESANPETVLKFSAAAYFFAKDLYDKYHVPIGLITSAVGGSPVEAWLSEEALQKFPEVLKEGKKYKRKEFMDSIRQAENDRTDAWYKNIQQTDIGLKGTNWHNTSLDDSSWETMTLPGLWKDNGLEDVNGVVWFRKEFNVPESMAGKPAKLFLGRIVDRDSAYINGMFVGAITYQYPPRRYTVPQAVLKAGKNVLSVRVINSAGSGGFIKDKPYELVIDNHVIDLKGEWRFKLGTTSPPLLPSTSFQYKPGGLYNGMIAPLTSHGIKGVIWYQGESNTENADQYQKRFSTMINDWRSKWNMGEFPFLYVQLCNFLETKDQPVESNWAALREAQRRSLAVSNTAMAVAIDIGEWNDIHPLNKKDIGKRLALAAMSTAYGDKKIISNGPEYESMKIEGNKIILTFKKTGGTLTVKGAGELKYFTISGADKKFVWAKAKISGNQIIVWNDGISNPTIVRYAWANNPQDANLYNKEGLPASPFTTE